MVSEGDIMYMCVMASDADKTHLMASQAYETRVLASQA